MGDSMGIPTDREDASTAESVADLIDALAFPVIAPLATDIAALSGLPPLPVPGISGPASLSQLDGVRVLMDGCGEAVAALRRHQNQTAALVAVMAERMEATAVLEGRLLELDWWQEGCAVEQVCAELATILHVSEGVAGRLIEQSVTLVRQLPASMEQLSSGALGWDHAVVIVEETSLLRLAGIAQETIDAFEQRLLGHAVNKTLPSFRSTARRLRERQYPETITARTRRAFADRSMRVSRGHDGMSWMSLYGPSPTIEAIWDQCTYTAQAAQGPHEDRTLTQLRVDIAAALLLRQSMDENSIHSPAMADVPTLDDVPAWVDGATQSGFPAPESAGADSGTEAGAVQPPWYQRREPDPCGEGAYPDPNRYGSIFYPWQVPRFDDPNYSDPAFREPDPRNSPEWRTVGQLPVLTPAGSAESGLAESQAESGTSVLAATDSGRSSSMAGAAGTDSGWTAGPSQSGFGAAGGEQWPPLPQVTPIVLIPVLSMLGVTNEPAWMEGAGPISMEVAKRLASQAGSMLRLLVDPITNKPLDISPDRYRISEAMRTQLRIRDEYCQFPGCNAKAVNCEVDHVKSFESGGRSIYNNLENLCARHHRIKHFKDDKDRYGKPRCIDEPERQGLRLRGWTPSMEEGGKVSWTSPSGRYCPPDLEERQGPAYPKWLKRLISRAHAEQGINSLNASADPADAARIVMVGADTVGSDTVGSGAARAATDGTAAAGTVTTRTDAAALEALAQEVAPTRAAARSQIPADGRILADGQPAAGEEVWDFENLPEPPAASPYDEEDNEILTRLAFEHALSHPWLGLAA